MPKYPWMQFFTGDWLKDPALTLCTPATRGVWIDLISVMHEFDQSGELRGTADQLARTARSSTVELVQALTDLQATGAADVTERNGAYCVRNRRMYAEARERKSAADRQKKHRDKLRNGNRHGPITPDSSEVRSQITPTPPAPYEPDVGGGGGDFESEYENAKPMMDRLYTAIDPQRKKLKASDREWIVKVAILAGRHGVEWIDPAFEAIKTTADIRRPVGLMSKELNIECERRGTTLNRELASIKIPVPVK